MISSFSVSDMKIDFLLNVMMLIGISHCRDVLGSPGMLLSMKSFLTAYPAANLKLIVYAC